MPDQGREQLRARVTGQVQGVGYRFFAVSAARRLSLSGYARNCPDGSVEVVAVGPRAKLLALVADLRRGPSAAAVDHVQMDFTPATGDYAAFDVRY